MYLPWILLTEAVGAVSGLLSMEGMSWYAESAVKPPLSPPGWVFGVVWPILYALMGIGAARVWHSEESTQRRRGINLFIAQLIVNFFWSLIFFNAAAYGFAGLWLILLLGLVIWMTAEFWKSDRLSALLQIPYIIWLCFALYLNVGAWLLNRG
jgi:tryptophan-rich sensory protein